ncbi:MAG: hypothetical protein KDD14_07350 [Saprospiraceae bacterium]|nr:hypothetical protein [Saprospiraceae bacterium]
MVSKFEKKIEALFSQQEQQTLLALALFQNFSQIVLLRKFILGVSVNPIDIDSFLEKLFGLGWICWFESNPKIFGLKQVIRFNPLLLIFLRHKIANQQHLLQLVKKTFFKHMLEKANGIAFNIQQSPPQDANEYETWKEIIEFERQNLIFSLYIEEIDFEQKVMIWQALGLLLKTPSELSQYEHLLLKMHVPKILPPKSMNRSTTEVISWYWYNLGYTWSKIGNLDQALTALDTALKGIQNQEIFEELGFRALNTRAIILRQLYTATKKQKYFDQLKAQIEDFTLLKPNEISTKEYDTMLTSFEFELAHAFQSMGDYNSALKIYTKAYLFSLANPDNLSLKFTAEDNMGTIFSHSDYEKSHYFFQEALKSAQNMDNLQNFGRILFKVAKLNIRYSINLSKAKTYLHKALEIFITGGDQNRSQQCIQILHMLEADDGSLQETDLLGR